MIEPVILVYMGEPSEDGGRRTEESAYTVDTFFSRDVTRLMMDPRISSMHINATCQILFEPGIPTPVVNSTVVRHNGVSYLVKEILTPTEGLGLDGTYKLLLTEVKT